MQSTQELNAAKYEAKLRELEERRLRAISEGLNKLDSLDTDKVGEELPQSAYVKAAHEGLARIMRRAAATDSIVENE